MRPNTEDEMIAALKDIAASAEQSDTKSMENTQHLIEAFGGYMNELATALKSEERQAALIEVLAQMNATLKQLATSSSSSSEQHGSSHDAFPYGYSKLVVMGGENGIKVFER